MQVCNYCGKAFVGHVRQRYCDRACKSRESSRVRASRQTSGYRPRPRVGKWINLLRDALGLEPLL